MPLLGELDREREGLRLPRLGEDWSAIVTRQTRKVEELHGAGERLRHVQGSRPKRLRCTESRDDATSPQSSVAVKRTE